MKIAKLLFLSLFVSLAVACSSSDDTGGSGETDAELVATWIGTAVGYTGTTVTEVAGTSITSDFVGEGFDIDYTVIITEAPNEITSEGSYSIMLTTTTAGSTIEQTVPNISFLSTGTWGRVGDELTITGSGATETYTITELTDTTLIINLVTEQDLSSGGATVTTTIDAFFTYTRG